jgi:hypothetical protein
MASPPWPQVDDAQLQASAQIADAIVTILTTERGVHAETAVASAGRLAGTFLFRSLGLPAREIAPGTPVFSDLGNERGPLLLQVLQAGLTGLQVQVDMGKAMQEIPPAHQPQTSLLETQQVLEPRVSEITASHQLGTEAAANACALAAALLVYRTKPVLQPEIGVGLVVGGLVEGSKTMPA